jgi:hypothetical protein
MPSIAARTVRPVWCDELGHAQPLAALAPARCPRTICSPQTLFQSRAAIRLGLIPRHWPIAGSLCSLALGSRPTAEPIGTLNMDTNRARSRTFRNIFPVRQFCVCTGGTNIREPPMHGLIYLIGLIIVIMAILSLFGLR